jgi:hypothetical protein
MSNILFLGSIISLIVFISIFLIRFLYHKHRNNIVSKNLFIIILSIYFIMISFSVAYLVSDHPMISYFHHSFLH